MYDTRWCQDGVMKEASVVPYILLLVKKQITCKQILQILLNMNLVNLSLSLAMQIIKDTKLFGIVMALVAVDVLILVIWQAVDPLTLEIKEMDREVYLQ